MRPQPTPQPSADGHSGWLFGLTLFLLSKILGTFFGNLGLGMLAGLAITLALWIIVGHYRQPRHPL